MNCPVHTATALVMSERHGIEIDYCPECRGVWLDRGELDKIIERAAAMEPAAVTHDEPRRDRDRDDDRDDDDDDRRAGFGRPGRGRRSRRESFLGDLFDFGG